MQIEKRKYYPQLNALRGIGVLSVFFIHSYKPNFGTGGLGQCLLFLYNNIYLSMDMFFALSAFIITHLALHEYQNHQQFSFKNFILRRILRIWPLYFIILAVTYLVLSPVAHKLHMSFSLPPASWYVFFVSNFFNEPHVFYLRQLWSVSVEEQFYVLWGFVLMAGYKAVKWVSISSMAIGLVFCLYKANRTDIAYFHSLVYLFPLMVGALFAYLNFKRNTLAIWAGSPHKVKTIAIYAFIPVFFVIYFTAYKTLAPSSFEVLSVFMRCLYIAHHCLMFIDQMHNEHSIFSLIKSRVLIYFGEISYGIYCWHGIILTFLYKGLELKKIGFGKEGNAILAFVITVAVATLSYRFVEKPFLKLKSRFK